MFNTFFGLPMHPLMVHFAVVLLPLSAMAFIAVVLVPRWRRPYAVLAVAGLAVGTVSAFVAKESGEALARTVGDPGDHARYGDLLFPLAGLTFLVAAGWWWLQRRRAVDQPEPAVSRLLGAGGVMLALASLVMTVVVGHTGATVVWGHGDAAPSSPTSTPATSSAAKAGVSYTLAQVATHSTRQDCWTTIDNGVYNVTSWISRHPGGADKILSLCGRDGSQAFNTQHGQDNRPHQELAGFKIGTLKK